MKKYGKLAAFLVIVLVILVLDRVYGWSAYLGSVENLQGLADHVRGNLPAALAAYILLTMVGCVVLALPGITFAVFAGLLFGPWLGGLAGLAATTLGAVAAFLAGRFFLRDSLKPLVMKNRWLKKVLFEETGRSDLVLLMITRLIPLFPYNLQNFAYGITDIRLGTYTLYTFVFMLPGVAVFTIGSAGLTAGADRWLYFAAAGLLFAGVFLLGNRIKKKYLQEPEKEG